jgi:hypothetical protein
MSEDHTLAHWRVEIEAGIAAGRLYRFGRQVTLWSRDPPLDALRPRHQFELRQPGRALSVEISDRTVQRYRRGANMKRACRPTQGAGQHGREDHGALDRRRLGGSLDVEELHLLAADQVGAPALEVGSGGGSGCCSPSWRLMICAPRRSCILRNGYFATAAM